jgi:hypothetical protein
VIPKETEAEIVRLYHGEKWPIGTIAGQLGIHHTTVQRVLRQTGVDRKIVAPRPSMVDPYVPFIVEQLEKYPGLRASRLFVMIKERGYPAGPIISGASSAAFAREKRRRLSSGCGRCRASRPRSTGRTSASSRSAAPSVRSLWAFVMVLSYSRRLFLRFSPGASMPFFVAGHVEASPTSAVCRVSFSTTT